MEPALLELLAEGSPDDEVAVIIRLSDPVALPAAVRVIAQFGPIVTCRLRRGDIPMVRGNVPVRSMKAARLYGPTPATDGCACHQRRQRQQRAPYEPPSEAVLEERPGDERRPPGKLPTGRGVVVAHIDWGVDIAHPDFRTADGHTRLLSIWDQSAAYNPQHSNRYGFGRIYDGVEIDRALGEPDPYKALGFSPAPSDRGMGTHGTHTLSISAGNGRAGGPVGLAPDAKLVFVHLSTYTSDGPTLLGDSVALLEALDFISRVAGPVPVVVNASLGRQAGEHTGTTLTEQGMDAFLLAGPGRAIVQSAGNYYDRYIHASGTLRPGERRTLRLITDAADRTPNEVDLWYPGVDRFQVTVRGPGVADLQVGPGQHARVTVNGRIVGNLYHRLGDPNNGDNQVVLILYQAAPPGEWELRLFGQDVPDGRFHAWVERDAACPRCQARFFEKDSNATSTTGTICNGLRTVAVGAYDAHAGDRRMGRFSSSGPTRDGRQKPEIVAPGVQVLAARSGPHDGPRPRPLLTRMSGTSMAAPHVAGTIALMFEAAGRPLFIEETRRMLLASADPPAEHTSATESLRLGSGYLNTVAAVSAARAGRRALAAPLERSSAPVAPLVKEAVAIADQLSPQNRYEAMTEFNESPEWEQSEPERVADDVVTEWVPAAEWAEPTEPSESMEHAEAKSNSGKRYDRSAPLPFQFQIPIGGGSPGLSVPVGGAGSPFAFSVPLGAPAAAPVYMQQQMGPALPHAVPSAAGAMGGLGIDDAPVAVAVADAPSFGEQILRAAEANTGEYAPSAAWLEAVLGEASAAESAYAEGDGSGGNRFPLSGRTPSATTLFNTFGQPHQTMRPRGGLRQHYAPHFAILAQPGQPLGPIEPRSGDLLVRVALGEGWGHLAVVASPGLYWYERLPDADLRGEGYPRPLAGWYVHVVEGGPRAHTADHRFARRIADADANVLHDSLLLRARSTNGAFETDESDAAGGGTVPPPTAGSQGAPLAKGMQGEEVTAAQRKLNRVHGDAVALGLPGLRGCPLPEDGQFSERMQQAVTDFQQQVFSDPSKWDGAIGADTSAQLDLVTGSGSKPAPEVPPEAPPEAPQRRQRPGRPGSRRLRRPLRESEAEVDEAAGRPTIRQGSQGPAVVEAQQKLNVIHANQVARGAPGFPECPLKEDGIFGSKTRKAVVAFQQLAFPGQPSEWDGVVGPKTWTALDQFALLILPPVPPVPPLPVPPPRPGPKPIRPALCALAPSGTTDPSATVVSRAGTIDWTAGTMTTSTGLTLRVQGNAFYPAVAEGSGQSFDTSTGTRVPIVFIAHGNHGTVHDPANRSSEFCARDPRAPAGAIPIPNHRGYVFFQEQLARMGIASVSVDCNQSNCTASSPQNITERAELIAAAINHFRSLDSRGDRIFGGHLDFGKVGLVGHSRGGEAVLLVPELTGSRAAAGVTFKGVLSIAPTNNGASSGTPRGFAFMTILPAGDGDVVSNDGAFFYDKAVPSPFKSQLYVHNANHNFFNTEWAPNPDVRSGAAPMTPAEHQRILSVFGCALFRTVLTGAAFEPIITGRELPPAVRNDKLNISAEIAGAVTVDDHEDGTPGRNALRQPITKLGYATAVEKPFDQSAAAFNSSFFGNTKGLIVKRSATANQFTSPLPQPTDLTGKEIWIRGAEVYTGTVPAAATGFRIGLVDVRNNTVFVDSDQAGGLPRPYDRKADDLRNFLQDFTKTMPTTFRFPASCFTAGTALDIRRVKAVVLNLNRGDGRELAFDQWQVV